MFPDRGCKVIDKPFFKNDGGHPGVPRVAVGDGELVHVHVVKAPRLGELPYQQGLRLVAPGAVAGQKERNSILQRLEADRLVDLVLLCQRPVWHVAVVETTLVTIVDLVVVVIGC